jgi:hypothetical protein
MAAVSRQRSNTGEESLIDPARAGRAELTLRYGSTGRPEHRFQWLKQPTDESGKATRERATTR